MLGKGDQTEQRSWWPKSNTWDSCGLNVGYWSADCEDWYQRRLESIRTGRAKPMTASEWRNLLKLRVTHTGCFMNFMASIADDVLTNKVDWRP